MDVDIIIIGTGMMGLATACSLGDIPFNIAVVDDKETLITLPYQPRVRASAINISSQRYFSQIGIWKTLLDSERILTFNRISVREKSGFAVFDANSKDYSFSHLGHIIENDLVTKVLYEKASHYKNITFFPHKVEHLFSEADKTTIKLTDGSMLSAKLIIAADGANSWVRETEKIKLWQYKYRHHALIATVKTAIPHNACARQLFYPDGVVAFLPLWVPNLSCLVWSAKPNYASYLASVSPDVFSSHLMDITSRWLGHCQVVSERHYFPLIARYTPECVMHRLILIGDAAHTIHPLAGQGANLGLRDSAELVSTIKQLYTQGADIGIKANWRSYQSARRKDVLMMLASMQGIETLFDGQFVLKKWARGLGMNMINHMPRIKERFLQYALGL